MEGRSDFLFYTYPPKKPIPLNDKWLVLSVQAPPLSQADSQRELLILDGTWRYAALMKKYIDKLCIENNPENPVLLEERSIPKGWRTAYPRRQEDCEDPSTGLASIEAIAIAYLILDRDPTGLFDNYHWKSDFLKINATIGSQYPGFTRL